MPKRLFLFVMMFFLIIGSTWMFSIVQVGEEVPGRYETQHPYVGKGVVWEQVFHWPEAGYIAIHFSEFDLEKGDCVEISSPDGAFVYRYDEKGKTVKTGKKQNVIIYKPMAELPYAF